MVKNLLIGFLFAANSTSATTAAAGQNVTVSVTFVRMRAQGHDDARIRMRLKSAGWDRVIVEEELLRK